MGGEYMKSLTETQLLQKEPEGQTAHDLLPPYKSHQYNSLKQWIYNPIFIKLLHTQRLSVPMSVNEFSLTEIQELCLKYPDAKLAASTGPDSGGKSKIV
ncbi:hypothetical protein UY3_06393 [Chelonia mydas]|uniref:Uncharacterized protein n=1 Tax=Chelonia mydas TaxID=8469 RepID=M7BEP4_CHEMY|nr:hypothetical protein UY3_06393 [Chelonia mydas]